ncbi:uncharacterized protein B0T15DRAFT_508615 [Chaetomium strumarium]|uniref:Uncharacterized protein n=1 Tax=Chaetomium strumarium TaxID=1170767 RepID=A0AAJ0GXQ7_9PEZI|nr:hypothetical protein B0T15DRAFT_508615 [Chaetomium strumarium]
MRRPRFRRTSSSRTPSWRSSEPDYVMPAAPSPTQMSFRNRDTGFPEPFCGCRNTSLPHPEANLSPDACITEEDVNPARALIRYRMTFKARQGFRDGSPNRRDRRPSYSSEEGTFAALGRFAINSLRTAEIPGFDAFLSSSKDEESIIESSDGMSSKSPDSPLQPGKEYGQAFDPRDATRDRRRGRRRGSFISRLVPR